MTPPHEHAFPGQAAVNYRHAYHAGNHGDVLKHIVLARLIAHMKKKAKPFRVIDAHAGIGLYDLAGTEAGKTGEWQGGAAKMAAPFDAAVESLIAPWREVLDRLNAGGDGLRFYPGSPEIVLQLLRETDRLVANELHPEDAVALERRYLRDPRVDVISMDAETCIKSRLPPPERRGVILIDPPYERKDEADRALRMLRHGLKRFAQGVFALWYPVKADAIAATVTAGAAALSVPATLRVELRVREAFAAGGLAGSGLVVVNAPWQIDADLASIMPALAERLGLGSWGQGSVDWLVPPG